MMSGLRRRSRYGCRNCKLRKIKCDEAKPNCLRCRLYGVDCNFRIGSSNLQRTYEKTPLDKNSMKPRRENMMPRFETISLHLRPVPIHTISTTYGYPSSRFTLTLEDKRLFDRFRFSTIYSMGNAPLIRIYEAHTLRMAFEYPFLMHSILALASVHNRYSSPKTSHRPMRELYHWSQCTILFNKWLSQHHIQEEHKDALWATASILAILTFASIDSTGMVVSDLAWMRLGTGKMILWDLLDPTRSNSVFHDMSSIFTQMRRSLPEQGIEGIPTVLARVCGLEQTSCQDNNPYFEMAHGVSQLLTLPQGQIPFGVAMMVSSHMHSDFITLISEKDSVALLLLSLWYRKVLGLCWWIDIRAEVELPVISSYLQQHHKSNHLLQTMVPCV